MSLDEIQERVKDLVEPFFDGTEIELVDLTIKRQGRDTYIEVLADKPGGGITIGECTGLNKAINRELENQGWLTDYYMEVASPGLDRPLKTNKDFLRAQDKEVCVILTQKINDKGQWTGIVQRVEEQAVTIDVKGAGVIVPYENIQKATLVI